MLPDWRLIYSKREGSVQAAGNATFNLWEVPISPQDGTAAGKPRRLTKWTGFGITDMSATADGKRAAFLKWTAQGDVYVASLQPGNAGIDTPRRLTLDERNDVPTAWSADSREIYFRAIARHDRGVSPAHRRRHCRAPVQGPASSSRRESRLTASGFVRVARHAELDRARVACRLVAVPPNTSSTAITTYTSDVARRRSVFSSSATATRTW